MMANEDEKKWNRPWSMDEMIENSENWSLAGDVALLNTIKAYSDNLLKKTSSLSEDVDSLLNNLSEVGLKLEISQNEFQSLRNSQFIESRVYEDDETVDIKKKVKEEEKVPSEEEKQRIIKEAVLEGLKVMDKYFDKIEVSISDSEGEDESEKSYVLQPKDLYADRPLPLVIGSEEWYKKWHAGLAETSSEEESDKETESYSDSDSDDHLPKDVITKGSETSSELDFSSQASENRPVANSTFNESTRHPDIFESDESEEQGSLPVKAPISNKNFAEQLAEKLGNVISEREDIPAEINKRPIQPARSNQFAGDLFSDEPPPLDDLDETMLPKSAQSGLFSGGRGLFDDNEDELFWGHDKVEKTSIEEKKTQTKQDLPADHKIPSVSKSSQISKGLFDSEESSDDELFAPKKIKPSKTPFLQPFKTTAPLFDEEPPALDIQEETINKPTNKTPEEPPQNINEKIPTRQEIPKPKKVSLFEDDVDFNIETPEKRPVPKKVNLFDDDDDFFKDDLFSSITSKKPTSNLFDAETSENPKIDLFAETKSEQKINKPKKVISLFSDEEEEEDEKRDVDSKTKEDQSKDATIKKTADKTDEFGNISEISSKIPDETADNKSVSESLSERKVIGAEKRPSEKAPKGLFDDDDDVDENIFKSTRDESPPKESLSKPPGLQVTVPTPQPRKEGISLFGSTPPPDDDIWDAKSDNFSDTEDQFSYHTDGNVASSLFDNEPPSLGPNESSGIVRDQNGTRLEADDSSFYPYASSSRRLSSDIFSEQQSQDSLFITKSRTESISVVPPSLDIIPEHSKSSYVDITPSGNLSDFENTTGNTRTVDSVFEETKPEKPKKPISLFDDDDNEDESEDLFGSRMQQNPLPILSEKRQLLFDDFGANKQSDVSIKNTDEKDSSKVETEVKSSPEKSKIANLISQIQSEPVKELPIPSVGSPGKLKHNLNINVSALMPGYAPPKLRDMSKSQSLDLPKEQEDTPSSGISTPDAGFFTPRTSIQLNKSSDSSSEKAVSFEDALDSVEVLHSITRDRAKIPIKRRPSTRRGRREAMTKSEADLSVQVEVPTPKQDSPSEVIATVEKNKESMPIQIDSPKKEITHEPPTKTKVTVQQENPVIEKPPVKDIFNPDRDSDEDLFPHLSAKTTNPKNKAKNAIFDSEDSDTDLFGTATTKRVKKETKKEKSKVENVSASKKSLFDDSSSDEDLFSTSKKGDKRKSDEVKVVEKKKQSSALRKLENVQTDDDPLSSLLK